MSIIHTRILCAPRSVKLVVGQFFFCGHQCTDDIGAIKDVFWLCVYIRSAKDYSKIRHDAIFLLRLKTAVVLSDKCSNVCFPCKSMQSYMHTKNENSLKQVRTHSFVVYHDCIVTVIVLFFIFYDKLR